MVGAHDRSGETADAEHERIERQSSHRTTAGGEGAVRQVRSFSLLPTADAMQNLSAATTCEEWLTFLPNRPILRLVCWRAKGPPVAAPAETIPPLAAYRRRTLNGLARRTISHLHLS